MASQITLLNICSNLVAAIKHLSITFTPKKAAA